MMNTKFFVHVLKILKLKFVLKVEIDFTILLGLLRYTYMHIINNHVLKYIILSAIHSASRN